MRFFWVGAGLILASSAWGKPSQVAFRIDLGFDFSSLPHIYSNRFQPVDYLNKNNLSTSLSYLSSESDTDPQTLVFVDNQYDPSRDNSAGKNTGTNFVYTRMSPNLYTPTLRGSFDWHPAWKVEFETGLWYGRDRRSSFNSYFILDSDNSTNFEGVVDLFQRDRFTAIGLFTGPVIRFEIRKWEFLKVRPFIETGLRVGTFFVLENFTELNAEFYDVINTETRPTVDGKGDTISAQEIFNYLSTGQLRTFSMADYEITKKFINPFSALNKWTMGLSFAMGERVEARLSVGLELFFIKVNKIQTTVKRDLDLIDQSSPTQEVLSTHSHQLSVEEPGFFRFRISYLAGIQFSLRI